MIVGLFLLKKVGWGSPHPFQAFVVGIRVRFEIRDKSVTRVARLGDEVG
jgi:hypothetical protein